MKRILYVFGLLLVILPLGIFATTGTVSLKCPTAVNKSTSISCDVMLSTTDGTIYNVKGNIIGGNYFTDNGSFNVTGSFSGSNIKIGTISSISKDLFGKGTISLSNITATSQDENSNEIEATINTTASQNITVLNDDNNLTNILINGKSINTYDGQNFSGDKLTYSINLEKTSSVNITATLSDSAASLSGTGNTSLKCGINTKTITAIAQDKTTKAYTITINRVCNNDTTLNKITISTGSLNPSFVSTTKEYSVKVSKDITKISINAEASDSTQKIIGAVKDAALSFGDNKFTLKVTSETGLTGIYNITVVREDSRSTNNSLSNIVLSEGKLVFDKDIIEYKTKVLNEITKINVTAIAEDKASKIEITGSDNLKVGENTILIKVTAEHGEQKEYKIIVNRLKEGETLGNNPDIAKLEIINYNLDFDPNNTSYSLKIDKEKVLNIRVTLAETTATYKIDGNKDLKNGSLITIHVTSEDGTTKDYKISIEKDNSTLIIVIAIGIIIITGGLITYLLISNKKNKNDSENEDEQKLKKLTVTRVKNKTTNEEEILSKVEEQLKQIEAKKINNDNNVSITKPISIVPKDVKDISKDDKILENTKEMNNINTNIESEKKVTKLCSICGHRVEINAEVCPYCKRTF